MAVPKQFPEEFKQRCILAGLWGECKKMKEDLQTNKGMGAGTARLAAIEHYTKILDDKKIELTPAMSAITPKVSKKCTKPITIDDCRWIISNVRTGEVLDAPSEMAHNILWVIQKEISKGGVSATWGAVLARVLPKIMEEKVATFENDPAVDLTRLASRLEEFADELKLSVSDENEPEDADK